LDQESSLLANLKQDDSTQSELSPFDISTNRIYSGLILALIRHYHSGNEFKEV